MAHEARTDWSMPLRSILLLMVGCVNQIDLGLTGAHYYHLRQQII
jgi:hypothetical protein